MKNFELSNKDWRELIKLYPEIKIPYTAEADYYVEQLGKIDDSIYKKISWYTAVKDVHEKPGSYKMVVADTVIKELKEKYLEEFNALILPDNTGFSEKKAPRFETGMEYISIDLKEANFNSFKYALGITDLPDTWAEYMRLRNYPELYVNSKSLRQLIFGNINPSRQVSFQKSLVKKLLTILGAQDFTIVSVSHDEVIVLPREEEPNLENFSVPLNIRKFKVFYFNHYDEEVAVKYVNDVKHKFYAIQGNRYFIHFAKIFLKRDPEERDLYFEPEAGKLAKWVL